MVRDVAGKAPDRVEIGITPDRDGDMKTGGSSGGNKRAEAEFLHNDPYIQGGLANEREFAVGWIEVVYHPVRRMQLVFSALPNMESEDALVGEIDQIGCLACESMSDSAPFFFNGHLFNPAGEVVGAILLNEALSADAIGTAFEVQRPILDKGEDVFGDLLVIVDHISLCQATFGKEGFVLVADLDGMSSIAARGHFSGRFLAGHVFGFPLAPDISSSNSWTVFPLRTDSGSVFTGLRRASALSSFIFFRSHCFLFFPLPV